MWFKLDVRDAMVLFDLKKVPKTALFCNKISSVKNSKMLAFVSRDCDNIND